MLAPWETKREGRVKDLEGMAKMSGKIKQNSKQPRREIASGNADDRRRILA
jgi:hypothetical protein